MNESSKSSKERNFLIAFIIITIALSFGVTALPLPGEAAPFLMVLIPAALALVLTGFQAGGRATLELIRNVFDARAGLKWYAIALVLALSMRLTMSLVAILLGWIPRIQTRPWSGPQFLVLAVILLISASLEGIGWRGYVLPRLLKGSSALAAALIIGVFWGALHISLSLPGMIYEGTPWLGTILELIGLSIVMTWLYIQTRGNIFITIVFHAAQSFFVVVNEGVSLDQQIWLMAFVYMLYGLTIGLLFGPHLITYRLMQSRVRDGA